VLLDLFAVLLLAWFAGMIVFYAAGVAIHVLLLLALASLAAYFVQRHTPAWGDAARRWLEREGL